MKFYVVGTPIGNLEDMTFRAVRVLKEADLILCEDTRVTKKLLSRYEISKPTLSYHDKSKISKIDSIVELIKNGKILALVSDAGTPAISDPGAFLVAKIREEFPEIEIVAIPGASALTAAISVAGLPTNDFVFLGFLPHKKGRETLFKEIAEAKRATVFYESPHRILKTLVSLQKYCGNETTVTICREITKVFEQTISGNPAELIAYFSSHPDKIKGEFVVINYQH
jgi:16S rRNA (cytidine1402-2'-O)-methyltransferase